MINRRIGGLENAHTSGLARHRHKPFNEAVKPSAAIGQTIDRLIQKGIVGESEEFDATGNSKGKLLRLVA